MSELHDQLARVKLHKGLAPLTCIVSRQQFTGVRPLFQTFPARAVFQSKPPPPTSAEFCKRLLLSPARRASNGTNENRGKPIASVATHHAPMTGTHGCESTR